IRDYKVTGVQTCALPIFAPERHAHDRVDDLDADVEALEILCLMRGAEQIAVGRIRLLGAHLVGEALGGHERRHFGATAEFVDERSEERRVGKEWRSRRSV